jgi:hypothetical protein
MHFIANTPIALYASVKKHVSTAAKLISSWTKIRIFFTASGYT